MHSRAFRCQIRLLEVQTVSLILPPFHKAWHISLKSISQQWLSVVPGGKGSIGREKTILTTYVSWHAILVAKSRCKFGYLLSSIKIFTGTRILRISPHSRLCFLIRSLRKSPQDMRNNGTHASVVLFQKYWSIVERRRKPFSHASSKFWIVCRSCWEYFSEDVLVTGGNSTKLVSHW